MLGSGVQRLTERPPVHEQSRGAADWDLKNRVKSMKRTHKLLVAAGIIIIAGLLGWLFQALSRSGSWTGGSAVIAGVIVAGVVGVGVLTGGLMWLAFYSARKGYDETPTWVNHDADRASQPGHDRTSSPGGSDLS
jgi:hypothetical protein